MTRVTYLQFDCHSFQGWYFFLSHFEMLHLLDQFRRLTADVILAARFWRKVLLWCHFSLTAKSVFTFNPIFVRVQRVFFSLVVCLRFWLDVFVSGMTINRSRQNGRGFDKWDKVDGGWFFSLISFTLIKITSFIKFPSWKIQPSFSRSRNRIIKSWPAEKLS